MISGMPKSLSETWLDPILFNINIIKFQETNISGLPQFVVDPFRLIRIFLSFKTYIRNFVSFRPAVLTHRLI
jgi:hypothetical protein